VSSANNALRTERRAAVAEYWRLWLAGEVCSAMVILQHRDGRWRVLCDDYEPNPVPRRRLPSGEGRARVFTGNLSRKPRAPAWYAEYLT